MRFLKKLCKVSNSSFESLSPKIRSVSLMGVNFMGTQATGSHESESRRPRFDCTSTYTRCVPFSRALRKLGKYYSTCTVTSGSWCPEFRLTATHFSSNFQLSRTIDSSCFFTLVFTVNQALVMSHYLHILAEMYSSGFLHTCRLIVNQSFHLPCVMPGPPSDGRTDGHLIERRKARNTVKVMVKARGQLRCRESGRAYSPFRIKLHGYSLSPAPEHAPSYD